MAYSKKVLEHYENPKNVGTLDKDDENVGTGLVGAPACGDVMKLQIKVNSSGIIEDAKFKAEDLAKQALFLAEHPEKRSEMGKNARIYVSVHFDRNKIAAEFLEKLKDWFWN